MRVRPWPSSLCPKERSWCRSKPRAAPPCCCAASSWRARREGELLGFVDEMGRGVLLLMGGEEERGLGESGPGRSASLKGGRSSVGEEGTVGKTLGPSSALGAALLYDFLGGRDPSAYPPLPGTVPTSARLSTGGDAFGSVGGPWCV